MKPILTLIALSLLAGCSAMPKTTTDPIPAGLVPPSSTKLILSTFATGVQIYECKLGTDGKPAWAFVAPEAALFDKDGREVGKHYAGPHWELPDGSKVQGTVAQRADAKNSADIPWLLLTTKSVGSTGLLSKVTHIQRINTEGGVAPATGCDAQKIGTRARMSYSTNYLYFG